MCAIAVTSTHVYDNVGTKKISRRVANRSIARGLVNVLAPKETSSVRTAPAIAKHIVVVELAKQLM